MKEYKPRRTNTERLITYLKKHGKYKNQRPHRADDNSERRPLGDCRYEHVDD